MGWGKAILNKITCRLIKKPKVIFDDIIHNIEPYAIIYAELIFLIAFIPVFTTIFNRDDFKYVGIGSPILTIFVIIPLLSLLALKYILNVLGLYDIIINIKITECPGNSGIIKTGKSLFENIRDAITLILGVMLFILWFVLFAEIIYFGAPYEPL